MGLAMPLISGMSPSFCIGLERLNVGLYSRKHSIELQSKEGL